MGKVIVIYKSRYGFTKKYAHWIAQELGAELMEAEKTKASDLQNYDVIIYGGGLYAGGVNGFSLITKSFQSIADKSLYLFTVGAADVSDKKNVNSIRRSLSKVVTPEMESKIKIFHFRGGIDYPRLSFAHRIMMGMMVKTIRKKPEPELSNEEKSMLATYGQVVDFTDKSAIDDMIDDIEAGRKL
ncbi:MAG TPA: flavodoxin domain-containing protein [Anaerovoracaceae bacterium]|nr:flavodoxin domain-containing protein [Anaerovoracaceae bacterium]